MPLLLTLQVHKECLDFFDPAAVWMCLRVPGKKSEDTSFAILEDSKVDFFKDRNDA
jgi:hypothetical protein